MSKCTCSPTSFPFSCESHQCFKTEHWFELCRGREEYRRAWDEMRGPGQLCLHRRLGRTCPSCRSIEPLTEGWKTPRANVFIFKDLSLKVEELGDIDLCVWPGGLILASDILRQRPQGTVIDVGCGTGIAGLAALAVGCQVTFLDRNPRALELASANARRNGFDRFDTSLVDWSESTLGQWSNIVSSETLWDPNSRGSFLRWVALHWDTKGTCRLAHSWREIGSAEFEDFSLTVSRSDAHLIHHGIEYQTQIYEVTA